MRAKVASIFWMPKTIDRSASSGTWHLEAVAKDAAPFILNVPDKVQRDQGPYSTSSSGRTRQSLRYDVWGHLIAADIVNECSQTGLMMNPTCHPGIWVVRERLPIIKADGSPEVDDDGHALWREATEAEAKAMWDEDLAANRLAQANYALALWNYWNGRVEADKRVIGAVPVLVKDAAKVYGFSAVWLTDPASFTHIKKCPICAVALDPTAIVCPNNHVVDFAAYAAYEAKKNAALSVATTQRKVA